MKQRLEQMGWVMYYECNRCGGKQYFNNAAYPKYEVRVKQKSHTFTILMENQVIAGPFHEYQLADKLKQYVQ